jgi:hypothetical protein
MYKKNDILHCIKPFFNNRNNELLLELDHEYIIDYIYISKNQRRFVKTINLNLTDKNNKRCKFYLTLSEDILKLHLLTKQQIRECKIKQLNKYHVPDL